MLNLFNRLSVLIAFSVTVVFSLPSMAAKVAADATIKFGMSAPFSGPAGTYGRQMKSGIEACFQKVNEGGGVFGRHLELQALDDGYELAPALANAKQLIEHGQVFALMAFYGTATSTAMLPVLTANDVPLVGTISGSTALREPMHPLMFHLRASYDDETATIVKQLVSVGIKRIAVFYQDDGFGNAGLTGVTKALAKSQLSPVAVASVPRNSIEVSDAVAKISAANPQAVVAVTLFRPTAAFITQLRKAGSKPYFVALSPVGTDQLISELGPEAARGVQVTQVIPYPWGDTLPVVREYKRDLQQYSATEPVSYYGLEGYLNARLIVEALQRAGPNPTRAGLIAALRKAPFDLGGYRLNFKPGGNSGSNYVEISVIGAGGRILN
jgi:ABC-type branched-subunit amino acid transport system substrate-binding protein